MLSPTTHPFIFNTLESSSDWDLVLKKQACGSGWRACLVLDCTSGENWHEATHAAGKTLPEALDRLESVLSGRESALSGSGAELSGREYVEPSATTDPEHEAYLARWKDAPEWAERLYQLEGGQCLWTGDGWIEGAGGDLLGSVRCEPRPAL